MEYGYVMFKLLLGHLFGDYLLQNKWMALNKTSKWWVCVIHCIVYTFCICLFLGNFSPLLIVIIFLTHFPIDYWSLGQKWLDLIKGRNYLKEFNDKDAPYRDLSIPFSVVVYCVADNTLHITLMWLAIVWLSSIGLY